MVLPILVDILFMDLATDRTSLVQGKFSITVNFPAEISFACSVMAFNGRKVILSTTNNSKIAPNRMNDENLSVDLNCSYSLR